MRHISSILLLVAIAACAIAFGYGTWNTVLYPMIFPEQARMDRQQAQELRRAEIERDRNIHNRGSGLNPD